MKSGENMTYDVIIIGAGAAGLYCGAHLKNLNGLIIDKNAKPGLKILASGGGQCNLTHGGYINAFYSKYGEHNNFIKSALKNHDNRAVINFFEDHGCSVFEREDGKVFPSSLKASDVVKALQSANTSLKLHLSEAVKEISHNGAYFTVLTDQDAYHSSNVVIATGGKSYPTLGTTGDGLLFSSKLGHSIVDTKPGLTGIVIKDKCFSNLQGVSIDDVKITMAHEGKKRSFIGPLLFTHFGFSGPVILNNSRYMNKGDKLSINFVNQASDILEAELLKHIQASGDKPVAFWLNQLGMTDTLKRTLFQKDEAIKEMKLATLSKAQRKMLVHRITNYSVEIESLIGYQNAMVTVGGVNLTEVEPKTMASKCVKGLYFCGEVLDVDGDTGGYNLQWAFSSGYAVAASILGDRD
ncbi:BaiN/RdsA family NAD(P)/FAD-dependent oxidoreductase [Fusibacter bizertensis]